MNFLPPKTNLFFINFIKTILPFVLQSPLKKLKVQISPQDSNYLKNCAAQGHLLLLPNHPTEDDPYVLLEISRQLNLVFNGVAARETFDWNNGLRGKIFQWLGSYSLIRGAPDRESFSMTKKLLIEGLRPLVIFIEGEISNQNDNLIPFETGVVQLAFKAQEELNKQKELNKTVQLLPLAIKYIYQEGSAQIIHNSLCKLKEAIDLQASFEDDYALLVAISQKVIEIQEKRLNINPSKDELFSNRIENIKNKLLQKLENFLDLNTNQANTQLERIRAIRNKIDKLIHAYEEPEKISDYEQKIIEELRKQFCGFYAELDRIVNVLTLQENYIARKHKPERFIEIIRRLEHEVYGKSQILHNRIAVVKTGQAINLQDYWENYIQNKKLVSQSITQKLEKNMQNLLDF